MFFEIDKISVAKNILLIPTQLASVQKINDDILNYRYLTPWFGVFIVIWSMVMSGWLPIPKLLQSWVQMMFFEIYKICVANNIFLTLPNPIPQLAVKKNQRRHSESSLFDSMADWMTQRGFIKGRVQSCVLRLPKYWPPPPSPPGECVLPLQPRRGGGGGTHSPGGEGGGGSIFWKTQDIGMASYSNNLSTEWPLCDDRMTQMTGSLSWRWDSLKNCSPILRLRISLCSPSS